MNDTSIHLTHILNAPIEKVWQAWAMPEHIAQWWGPAGFTTTIHLMEFRENGEWKLTLHGPDGTNFANRSIFKIIDPLREIVFEHFNPHFITSVYFSAINDKTEINWSLAFDTVEMRNVVANVHNAEQGQHENIAKLEKYLQEMP